MDRSLERNQPVGTTLSDYQGPLWFLSQLAPGSGAYNIGSAYAINGPLDVRNLSAALNIVARRHHVLRGVFRQEVGNIRQVPSSQVEVPLRFVEVSLPLSDTMVISEVQDEIGRPFDLGRDIPIRALVLSEHAESHLILLVVHHLVADAQSLAIIWRDLERGYGSEFAHDAEHLPAQYAEYTRLWRDPEHVLNLEVARRYWANALAGMPTSFELPTQHRRPATRDFAGATYMQAVAPDVREKLAQYCRRTRATPATVLFAVYQIVLFRYTGRVDFAIGVPVTVRTLPGSEDVVGLFVNMSVIRARIDPEIMFATLVQRVTRSIAEALDYCEYPFSALVRDLNISRDLSREPLVQVVFNYIEESSHGLRLDRAFGTHLTLQTRFAKNDFSLQFVRTGDDLLLLAVYDQHQFDESFVQRFCEYFVSALEGAISAHEVTIRDLHFLSKFDRQLLLEWNDPPAEFSSDRCVHELFEAQVARTPDAIAVVFEGEQLTYRELNERANQLAHYLRSLGAKPDTLVAICVERSLEMIIGLFGILKAGGAYVPLDPEYPVERLAYMLEDTAAPVLVTQARLRESLPKHHAAQVVCIDSDWATIAQQSEANPSNKTAPQHLAYCIYTSGSTGNPKGALITHEAIASHVQACIRAYELRSTDRVLQFASINFDASLEQILAPLSVGASIFIRGNEIWTPGELLRHIGQLSLTVVNVTPVYWRALVDEVFAVESRALRLLILGGEAIPGDGLIKAVPSSCHVLNAYGPTEATITASTFAIWGGDATTGTCRYVPIGKRLGDRQLYILDGWLDLVPIGVVGEICIAGIGLARGYLNRPELTAEKFIPNPFGETGSRVYRTGDLGRYLPDGNIEFVGRIDEQVKIRGFRVELGEVEAVLLECAGIREGVVIVREDSPGDKRLVAYVVAREGVELTVNELRGQLQRSLPEYMVPGIFVRLEKLPIAPNGKIDRKALPIPAASRVELGTQYVAPRTNTEELLAEIWAEVLRLDKVGIYDNFFASGGHSLLATQVAMRIRSKWTVELRLRSLFDFPTLSALATHIDELIAQKSIEVRVVPLAPRRMHKRSPHTSESGE